MKYAIGANGKAKIIFVIVSFVEVYQTMMTSASENLGNVKEVHYAPMKVSKYRFNVVFHNSH